jgi:hypothetical protein
MLHDSSFRSTPSLMLASAALLLSAFAQAQTAERQDSQYDQPQSAADAARNTREQKKIRSNQPKIITNDDIDLEYFKPGNTGLPLNSPPKLETQPPSPDVVAAVELTDKAAVKPPLTPEEVAKFPEVAELKAKIALVQKQIDLDTRELALNENAYYSKPNYAEDTAGKAQLDAEREQIKSEQQELDKLKADLARVEERLKLSSPNGGDKQKSSPPAAAPAQDKNGSNPPSPESTPAPPPAPSPGL